MLRNEHFPLRLLRIREVNVDQAVVGRMAVRLEREHCPFVGHVVIFSFKVVDQFYPLQDSWWETKHPRHLPVSDVVCFVRRKGTADLFCLQNSKPTQYVGRPMASETARTSVTEFYGFQKRVKKIFFLTNLAIKVSAGRLLSGPCPRAAVNPLLKIINALTCCFVMPSLFRREAPQIWTLLSPSHPSKTSFLLECMPPVTLHRGWAYHPRGHLEMSEDVFGCHNLEGDRRATTGIQWVEARDATKHTSAPYSKDSASPGLHISFLPDLPTAILDVLSVAVTSVS